MPSASNRLMSGETRKHFSFRGSGKHACEPDAVDCRSVDVRRPDQLLAAAGEVLVDVFRDEPQNIGTTGKGLLGGITAGVRSKNGQPAESQNQCMSQGGPRRRWMAGTGGRAGVLPRQGSSPGFGLRP